ncbi:unnamed protein product [Cuscuta epithymum]|uniref:HSF-type DNA-binding domain-containing protein n=1 Tax=Cuscuta epithymum TaxID=186058 RepID=A0AAV0FG57_9ASTE|nr:unnamed protein product [Cuscuta epithymum]
MVKSVENGVSVAPFLIKCYEMVDDESTDALISWSRSQPSSGDSTSDSSSFIIWDVSNFSSQLLPKYFKHSNFSSFVRQLNIYGFRKTDTDRWEFSNDKFIRGQKHLLANIIRRKNAQNLVPKISTQQQQEEETIPSTSEEDKSLELWKEVETLKTDKNTLMQELIKLRQHQQISQSKLLLIRKQVKGMEKNQQQMLSFIVMAIQNPGFLVQFLHPKENNWIMSAPETGPANVLGEVDDGCGLTHSGGTIVKYQPRLQHHEVDICSNDIEEENNDHFTTGGVMMRDEDGEKSTDDLDFSLDEDDISMLNDIFGNIDFSTGPSNNEGFTGPSNNEGSDNVEPIVISDVRDWDDDMLEMLLSSPTSGRGEAKENGQRGQEEVGEGEGGNFEFEGGMDKITEQMDLLTKF